MARYVLSCLVALLSMRQLSPAHRVSLVLHTALVSTKVVG